MSSTSEKSQSKKLTFDHNSHSYTLTWISENHFSTPKKVIVIDDSFPASQYITYASQGVSFVWKGDYNNGKQLLQAVQRRIKKHVSAHDVNDPQSMAKEFYRYRQYQAYKAQILSRLLIRVEGDLTIQLPRAPDLRKAIHEAIREITEIPDGGFLISLRELHGFVGAHEWRKKGVPISALDGKRIHPYFGVFSPVRGEYLDLIARAPLPDPIERAFDIGTGTGVISAILAHRGVARIIATDLDQRALACASDNIRNLGLEQKVEVQRADLFPEGKADLIVCNPPWLPVKPTSAIERAVYDEDSQMTKSFLKRVGNHLSDRGEAWLIISNLAEHLGLRPEGEIQSWISQAGLETITRLDTKARHQKAEDSEDALYVARSREVTSLWRLRKI